MAFKSIFLKTSGWYRLLAVGSCVWLIAALYFIDPWARVSSGRLGPSTYSNWDEFFIFGVLPIVLIWGAIWVAQGFKRGKADK